MFPLRSRGTSIDLRSKILTIGICRILRKTLNRHRQDAFENYTGGIIVDRQTYNTTTHVVVILGCE